MFVAVYRWRARPGLEDQFRDGWHRGTEAIRRRYGSLGSRLHRASDGAFIGYAQWASRADWQRAFDAGFAHDDPDGMARFRDAIIEREPGGMPIMTLEVVDDLLEIAR